MIAAFHGNLNVVASLLAKGAEPNPANGWTPLMYAAFKGHTETVRLLLDNRARVDAVTDNGTSALMLAAMEGHREVVELLLAKGANAKAANASGKSAIDFALSRGNTDIAGMLGQADEGRLEE
jgi:hypothetical protein